MEDNKVLHQEVPSFVYMPLGRRGRERLPTEQCFLPGCENAQPGSVKVFQRDASVEPREDDETVQLQLAYHAECEGCGGTFQYVVRITGKLVEGKTLADVKGAFENVPPTEYVPDYTEYIDSQINVLDVWDAEGKNLGNVGYW